MKQAKVYIGIDVAKGHLDVAWEQTCWRMANDARAHQQLVQRLKQTSGASLQVICEASGGYERSLLLALARGGIEFSLVQASRVRQYARACGQLAKTDSIDAQLLARFGQAVAPPSTKVLPAEHDQLRQLESQRRHLLRLLVAQQNRRAQLSNKTLLRLNSGLIGQLRKQIASDRSAPGRLHRAKPRARGQSAQTHLHRRSGPAHRHLAPGPNARTRSTQSSRSGRFGRPRSL